uniref:CNNM transmembrane domain-containing protein n=1 Tax=Brassica oleracea var. oleracea TaxID=109376 RepID=A0A0D3ABC5_BRAOL
MLHVLKDYTGVSCFLVLFAGIMSGLTLGLMSLGLVVLEILQLRGTPNKKKQATVIFRVVQKQHQLLVTLLLCNAVAIEMRGSFEYLTKDASSLIDYINKDAFLAMAKRAKAELKGGTLKTVSDKGNGSNSAKSLTGSEKAKPLKKTELVKKPLPKMTKTPGKSVVEVKERKGPGSRGSQEIKDHGHVKFLLPGFPRSSPKTK